MNRRHLVPKAWHQVGTDEYGEALLARKRDWRNLIRAEGLRNRAMQPRTENELSLMQQAEAKRARKRARRLEVGS